MHCDHIPPGWAVSLAALVGPTLTISIVVFSGARFSSGDEKSILWTPDDRLISYYQYGQRIKVG
jgi:hypothetical protein